MLAASLSDLPIPATKGAQPMELEIQLMRGGVMVGGKGSSLTLAMAKMESTRFIFQVCTVARFFVLVVACVSFAFSYFH